MPFDKSRLFFGAQLGDYCNSKILKSHGFIGFNVCSVAAGKAVTFKFFFNRFLEDISFSFFLKSLEINGFKFLFYKKKQKNLN